MITRKLFVVLCILLSAAGLFAQGVTTGSMNGTVTGNNGDALPGATVIATHTPTGTKYGTSTREDGKFNLANVRVGGPYTVVVSYVGYANYTLNDVYVTLGQDIHIDPVLTEENTVLDMVTVRAQGDVINSDRTGAQTKINEATINSFPTINRDVNDFAKMTPQASVNGDGISIAGTNNRYNAIFIDGAVNNDVFGLASSGSNGGQLGISPIALDAIEQFQISVAPYDVTLGGFAGGGINALTRSGSNTWEGSAYYYMRNENLTGKTHPYVFDPTLEGSVSDLDTLREKLAPYNANLYGFRIGGPIKKDKVFFFVNAELQREDTPQPFAFSNYESNYTEADLNNLINYLNELGYDPGGYLDNTKELTSDKVLVKVDWNLSDKHKLTLRHSYVKGVSTSPLASNPTTINFYNNGIYFPSITNSSALELNSLFNNSSSNNLIIGYTNVNDDRDPMGADFPSVDIKDPISGNTAIKFGSEPFSTANQLKQSIFTVTDNFKLYKGDHTITIGTHNEFYNIYNLFIRYNYGYYVYNELNDFLNDSLQANYQHSYSLVDNITGDGSGAAADFNAMQLALYAQDKYDIKPNFNITVGLRIDLPVLSDDPTTNPEFNDSTIALIESYGYYDLKGAVSGQAPKPGLMFSPRIGFNWDVKGNGKTQVRGGIGIFTSRIPFVWPGGMYTINGYTVGGYGQNPSIVPFVSDPFNQPVAEDAGLSITVPSGEMNIFTENFKYPQVLRGSLAADQKLPWGMTGTIEGIYSKILNNINYYNINAVPPTQKLEGADDRPYWPSAQIDKTYTYIILGDNTNEGYSYSVTGMLRKSFTSGLSAFIAYTYGDAWAINDGTSSQNSSQWRYIENVDGKNDLDLSRSDYSMGSRLVSNISYAFAYGKQDNFKTTLSLYYNGQSGRPYSFVYSRNLQKDDISSSTNSDLIFIPASPDDINLVDKADGTTAAEQWDALDAFISNDPYLSAHRGEYAERNGARTPFENLLDLRIMQEFAIKSGDNTNALQLSLDILNIANLLNAKWGAQYYVPNDAYSLITLVSNSIDPSGGDLTPDFQFTAPADGDVYSLDDLNSRWRMQFGVRYVFN